MKKKYLMVLFHEAYATFDNCLTDVQKDEFFKDKPGLRWIEGDTYKVN
jgi:hypothetical protein